MEHKGGHWYVHGEGIVWAAVCQKHVKQWKNQVQLY